MTDSKQYDSLINNLNKLVNNNDHLFSHYDDILPYTKTFIINMNLTLNISEIFKVLPVTEYKTIPKKRGRKKKNEKIDFNNDIKDGSIITLKYKGELRGVDLKKKENSKKNKYFRNSITVVIIFANKKINFKISQNGKFQMTGCKTIEHAVSSIQYIWSFISSDPSLFSIKNDSPIIEAVFIPAMRNIHFQLGFNIDREKLNVCINRQTPFQSLYETSVGYTGVNIKMQVDKSLSPDSIFLLKMSLDTSSPSNSWSLDYNYPYSSYVSSLCDKDKLKKSSKNFEVTFLVFQSGSVIQSVIHEFFGKPLYYSFLNIIYNHYDDIREHILI